MASRGLSYAGRCVQALQAEGEAGEEGAGDGGAVDVACIAVHATVEVALVGIEDVLHPGVYLEGVDLIERYVIGQLEAGAQAQFVLHVVPRMLKPLAQGELHPPPADG